ncbi:MAG: hypothetical protein QXL27_09610 [Candidatus Bathyarchaeia archaeon]
MLNLKSVKIAILILAILFTQTYFNPITSTPSPSKTPPSDAQPRSPIDMPSNMHIRERIYNVTLITGDSVLVVVAENGTILSVAIQPADLTKLGQNFLVFKIHNSTYVIPSNLDIRKFDLDLFNIDLLIRDGYEELLNIPIIVEYHTDLNTFIRQLKTQGANVAYKFSILRALAVRIPKDRAGMIYELLNSSQDVRKVWLDRKVYSNLDESAPLIGATDAWELGINGSGVGKAPQEPP